MKLPSNIEELIAVYLLEKAEALKAAAPESNRYIALYVGTSAYAGAPLSIAAWASTELSDGSVGVPTTRGSYLNNVVDQHIAAMKAFDPLAAKKAERDKLAAEIAELEKQPA